MHIMGYNKPYRKGQYNPLYNLNNQVFFIAHLEVRRSAEKMCYEMLEDGRNQDYSNVKHPPISLTG